MTDPWPSTNERPTDDHLRAEIERLKGVLQWYDENIYGDGGLRAHKCLYVDRSWNRTEGE